MPVQTQLQMRRDTAANWTSTNPTLASGEWGLETDTRLMKIGDGATAWNSLGYQLNSLLDEELATDPNGAYFDGTGLRIYGNAGNLASTPDAAALDITGDIDIRVKIALTDWTPSGVGAIVTKWGAAAQRSYYLRINTDGTLRLDWSADGSTGLAVTSTVATGLSDGSTKWIRATLDVNNGAAGRDGAFYLSDDGTNWTQLGNTVTQAGTTSIFSGTEPLRISTVDGTVQPFNGTIYRAQVLNGIGGTTAFDANFETVPADSFAFTESSANAATVTLTTTRYSFGVPGATLTGTTTVNYLRNFTVYHPFTIKNKPVTIKHMALETTTAPTANTSIRLGIYAADMDNQPTGNIIYSSDAITIGTTNAIYRIRITPTTLKPGNYLAAINTGANSATWRFMLGNLSAFTANTLGTNLTRAYAVETTISGALPTTGTKWNQRNVGNTAAINPIFLGW